MGDLKNKADELIKKLFKKEGRKFGKDTFFILLIGGLLLFVIAMPTSKDDTGNEKKSGQINTDFSTLFANSGDESAVSTAAKANKTSCCGCGECDGGCKSGNCASCGKCAGGNNYINQLENELKTILEQIDGAGAVKVMITANELERTVVEKDTSNSVTDSKEEDSAGGKRDTYENSKEDSTVYTVDSSGNKVPFISQKVMPKVEGVLVAAQGAKSAAVERHIVEAVQALFGLETYKIKVVSMK